MRKIIGILLLPFILFPRRGLMRREKRFFAMRLTKNIAIIIEFPASHVSNATWCIINDAVQAFLVCLTTCVHQDGAWSVPEDFLDESWKSLTWHVTCISKSLTWSVMENLMCRHSFVCLHDLNSSKISASMMISGNVSQHQRVWGFWFARSTGTYHTQDGTSADISWGACPVPCPETRGHLLQIITFLK